MLQLQILSTGEISIDIDSAPHYFIDQEERLRDNESEFDDIPPLEPVDEEGRSMHFDESDDIPPLLMDDTQEILLRFPSRSMFRSGNRRTRRTIKVDNPIIDTGLDWDSVNPDPKYVEMLALAYFDYRHGRHHIPKKDHREKITSGILTVLHEQEKSEKIIIPATYNNTFCINKLYTKCVLDACRTIFEETQYF